MKHRLILLGVLAALVSACGQEPAPTNAASQPAAQAEAAAQPTNECVTAKGYELLPPGMCVTQALRFQNDNVYADTQGRQRRRVSFRYEGADAQAVVASMTLSLTKAGFFARDPMPTTDGSTQVPFTKDRATLYLRVKDKDAASGSLFVDYMMPGQMDAVATTPAAPDAAAAGTTSADAAAPADAAAATPVGR